MEHDLPFEPSHYEEQLRQFSPRLYEERVRSRAVAEKAIFDSTQEGHYRLRRYKEARFDLPSHGIDLTLLSPTEVVSLERRVTAEPAQGEVDDATELRDHLAWTLDNLPALDTPRGAAILTAFAGSPLPTDRAAAARDGLVVLTQFDHDAGVTLWGRLVRDTDKSVRDASLALLDRTLADYRMKPAPRHVARKGSGFYTLDRVDRKQLQEQTGITPDDARELLESYALAENGSNVHDMGAVALGKLLSTDQMTE